MAKDKSDTVRLAGLIRRDQDEKLIALSHKTGATKSWLIREAIDAFLKNQKR